MTTRSRPAATPSPSAARSCSARLAASSGHRTRPFAVGSLLLAAVLAWAAAAPSAASQQSVILTPDPLVRLTSDPETGLLFGEIAAGAKIASALLRIGRQAGIEVQLRADLGEVRRPIALDGVSVETALTRVTRGHSLALFYGAGETGSRRLRTVWVIAEGTQPGTPVPPPRLTAEWQEQPEPPEAPPDPVVVRAVGMREISKLSYRADASAVEALRAIARGSDDPALRRSALSALAGIAPTASFRLFEKEGLRDASADVRIEAARSLLRTGNPRGSALVRAAAQRESDPVARDILERLANGEVVARSPTGLSRTND